MTAARSRSLALILSAIGFGCQQQPPVIQDLSATLSLADREAPWQTILFGSAASDQNQELGFLPASGRFAWVQRRPETVFRLTTVEPRVALLDASLPEGLEAQTGTVALNGAPIGTVELLKGRRRYRLDLPADQQRVGINRLSFVFRQATKPADPDAPRLAAGFFSLSVGSASSAPFLELLAPEAPPPFSIGEVEGAPALFQAGPSRIDYVMEARPGTELRFTPELSPRARTRGQRIRLSIRTQSEGSPERELWSAEVSAPDREVALPLPFAEPGPLRVSFQVESEQRAWAVWRSPRIVATSPAATPQAPRPARALSRTANLNVVAIVLDAAGAAHFGCYGYARATTPEIDRLAREGIVFERAFTPAVFTLSAMSSVWTSEYHDQNHAGAAYDAPLPKESKTLAELLSARGIHTTSVIANGMAGRGFGLDRGFTDYLEAPLPYDADSLAAMVPALIQADRGRRFFTYLHFREPHFPYDPGPPYATMFGPDAPLGQAPRTEMNWMDRVNARSLKATPEEMAHLIRLYDGNLTRADHAISKVRKELEANGLWDRTAVIVMADHGEALGEHGFIGHNLQLYDESIHVPLVVRLPGGPSGLRIKGLVDLLDVAPTIAEIFGAPQDQLSAFQGRSLLPLIAGDAAAARAFVVSRSTGPKPKVSWRDDRFKLILNTRYGNQELYDLVKDPGEQLDIRDERPLIAALYRQRLLGWIEGHRSNRTATGKAATLTKEQIENLKALGYLH